MRDERMKPGSAIRAVLLAGVFLLGGCAVANRSEEAQNVSLLTVTPGQSLLVRVEGKNDLHMFVEESYMSALGERCARVRGPEGAGLVCLQGGVWEIVPSVAPSVPSFPEPR